MASASAILKDSKPDAAAKPEASAGSWSKFWSGSAQARAEDGAAVDAAAPSQAPAFGRGLSPAPEAREGVSQDVPAPYAGAAVAGVSLAGISLPAWASEALGVLLPYGEGAGVLAATWGATRLVSWGLEKLWKGRKWDRNLLIVTRMAATVVLWLAGATIALKVAGMDWSTLLTGLGVGGLAISMSVRKVLGNFIYGAMLLADHPFRIGERLKIGDTEYTVKDMTFRYIVLEQGTGSHSLMDYSQLAGKPLRLYRRLGAREPGLEVSGGAQRKSGGGGLVKWLVIAGAASAIGGGGWAVQAGLTALQPYVLAAAALGVSWLAARLFGRLLRRIAERHHWDPTLRALLQTVLSGVVYLTGLIVALSALGVSTSAILAGAGVLSVGVTIAATDMVSNLLEAGWILISQPFRVGDRIRVGDQEGTVVDMTLRNVVLSVEENGRTDTILLPYSLVGGSTLTVYKDYVKAR